MEREQLQARLAADLRDEKAEAEKDKATLKRMADETHAPARRTPAVVWLDVIKRSREPWERLYADCATNELLNVLNQDSSLVPFVASEYERYSADDFIAAKLLRVLYASTSDVKWLNRVAARLGRTPDIDRRVFDYSLSASHDAATGQFHWKRCSCIHISRIG